jgi:hypothetical protein
MDSNADGVDSQYFKSRYGQPGSTEHGCYEPELTDEQFLAKCLPGLSGFRSFPGCPNVDLSGLQGDPMALQMAQDLIVGKVAIHRAPPGAGKSYRIRRVTEAFYRAGERVLIAVPTLKLARETIDELRSIIPDAFEAGAVAEVFGRKIKLESGEEIDSEDGEYPLSENTRIIVCTHHQLGRHGWSKFICGLIQVISNRKASHEFQGFHIMIDEDSAFINNCRHAIPLTHRTKDKDDSDGSAASRIPNHRCPMSSHSGNCGNCALRDHGGSPHFDDYGYRRLGKPWVVRLDENGRPTGSPHNPLRVSEGDLKLETKKRSGFTTWAAEVLEFKYSKIGTALAKPIQYFSRVKDSKHSHPRETHDEILAHMLGRSHNPIVSWEYPIGPSGSQVDVSNLKRKIKREDEDWSEGVRFPHGVCEVPSLLFTDREPLESLRRYAEKYQTGLLWVGATSLADDEEILSSVFPLMWPTTVHPYPDRKIKQVAIVSMDGHRSLDELVGPDGKLVTFDLESFGQVITFCPTKEQANKLFESVRDTHETCFLSYEDHEHLDADRPMESIEHRSCIAYSRGVVGRGVNKENVRVIVVDADAYRPISSFTPGKLSIEDFEQARATERVGLIVQNIGRGLRGEEGKIVAVIVRNSDPMLMAALNECESIREGSELPPLFVSSTNIHQAIDQARRWFEADGGDWPSPDLRFSPKNNGRPRKDISAIIDRGKAARAAGMSLRDFFRKEHLERLSPDERERVLTETGFKS